MSVHPRALFSKVRALVEIVKALWAIPKLPHSEPKARCRGRVRVADKLFVMKCVGLRAGWVPEFFEPVAWADHGAALGRFGKRGTSEGFANVW